MAKGTPKSAGSITGKPPKSGGGVQPPYQGTSKTGNRILHTGTPPSTPGKTKAPAK